MRDPSATNGYFTVRMEIEGLRSQIVQTFQTEIISRSLEVDALVKEAMDKFDMAEVVKEAIQLNLKTLIQQRVRREIEKHVDSFNMGDLVANAITTAMGESKDKKKRLTLHSYGWREQDNDLWKHWDSEREYTFAGAWKKYLRDRTTEKKR